MSNLPLTVLDCTLRDGGYYNNWDFAPSLVLNYLAAVSEARIDVVEIGFRFLPKDRFLGAHAYTTDAYLETLELPKNMQFAVMVNAADLVGYADGADKAIDALFDESANSPISLVRIASHFSEAGACRPAVDRLKILGYDVGFNLMQISEYEAEEITNIITAIKRWNAIDVLYFADSLGSMDTDQIKKIVDIFHQEWEGDVGIHAHDNMGQALANTFAAINNDANWVDATILGMGRGPVNLRMEYLLLELSRRNIDGYQARSLFPLVLNDFHHLIEEHRWGPNLFYFLSASYGIHPTYVQEMLKAENYNPDLAISALETLSESDSNSFKFDRLQNALRSEDESYSGTWSATGWAKGRTVLLVGSGPWVQDHIGMLVNYIDEIKPVVICLNTKTSLPDNQVTAFAACHPFRVAMEVDHYRDLGAPLIAPLSSFPPDFKSSLTPGQVLDYGISVSVGQFEARETECVIPRRLVAAYALAVANAADASEILLAGFDGYLKDSPLQREMEEVLECYRAVEGSVPIKAVTPTTYSITQSSIFAPQV